MGLGLAFGWVGVVVGLVITAAAVMYGLYLAFSNQMKSAGEGVLTSLWNVFLQLIGIPGRVALGAAAAFETLLDGLGGMLQGVVELVRYLVRETVSAVSSVVMAVWSVVSWVLRAVYGLFEVLFGALFFVLSGGSDTFRQKLKEDLDGLVDVFMEPIRLIKGLWDALWNGISSGAAKAWNSVKGVFGGGKDEQAEKREREEVATRGELRHAEEQGPYLTKRQAADVADREAGTGGYSKETKEVEAAKDRPAEQEEKGWGDRLREWVSPPGTGPGKPYLKDRDGRGDRDGTRDNKTWGDILKDLMEPVGAPAGRPGLPSDLPRTDERGILRTAAAPSYAVPEAAIAAARAASGTALTPAQLDALSRIYGPADGPAAPAAPPPHAQTARERYREQWGDPDDPQVARSWHSAGRPAYPDAEWGDPGYQGPPPADASTLPTLDQLLSDVGGSVSRSTTGIDRAGGLPDRQQQASAGAPLTLIIGTQTVDGLTYSPDALDQLRAAQRASAVGGRAPAMRGSGY